ncbi:hypothetical protein Tco_0733752 [Tanacetum coccineum]
MTTHSAGRGGATPRGRRTDARRGMGGGQGNAINGNIGNNGNNDGIGNAGNGNGESGENNANGENNKEGREHGNPRDGGNNNNGNRCSYKEFLACQPNKFDGKSGAIAYTRWVEKMKSVIDMSNYAINQRVKYVADDFKTLLRDEYCPYNEMQKLENEFWNHTMIGDGHTAYTDRFHALAKLVPHLVTPEFKRIDRYIYCLVPEIHGMVRATEPTTIQSAILKAGGLIDDAIRNGLLKRSSEKRKENGETSKQEDARSNNKKARTRKGSVATNSGKKEYKGLHPKCANCSYHH